MQSKWDQQQLILCWAEHLLNALLGFSKVTFKPQFPTNWIQQSKKKKSWRCWLGYIARYWSSKSCNFEKVERTNYGTIEDCFGWSKNIWHWSGHAISKDFDSRRFYKWECSNFGVWCWSFDVFLKFRCIKFSRKRYNPITKILWLFLAHSFQYQGSIDNLEWHQLKRKSNLEIGKFKIKNLFLKKSTDCGKLPYRRI